MHLYHDIRVGTISVIVKKHENKTFVFECSDRIDDGFIFVLEGDGTYSDKSGEYKLKKHSVMLLQKGDKYSIKSGKNGLVYLTTAFNLHPQNAFRESGLPPCTDTEKHPYILKQALEILKVWEKRSQWYLMETRIKIEQLILDLINCLNNNEISLQFKGRLEPALSYINQNYDKPIKNEILADLCNLSVTHFRRLFSEQIGKSPLQYREAVRVHWAIKQLESRMFTISEIAERLGYSDIYHFSKVIKKHTGNPPSFYKK